jgi:hypothetical protein
LVEDDSSAAEAITRDFARNSVAVRPEVGPRRRLRNVLASAVAATWLLGCPDAFGWDYEEHTELGSKGYQCACEQLAQELNLQVNLAKPSELCAGPKADHPALPSVPEKASDPSVTPKDGQLTPASLPKQPSDPCVKAKDDATVRWCLACRAFSPELYGQSVAIAGDHVGSPDELMSPDGQVVSANVMDYTFLALVNHDHFHPDAMRHWRAFHDKALELATKDFPNGPIARDFAQVFYTAAFAEHFLQDAFAAGHAGFNRPSSGAVASKAFHDIWNSSGRLVKSPTGRCWLQYGDGKLKYASKVARYQIDEAERSSAYDVLAAFVTGKRDAAREIRPVYFVPSEITKNPLPGAVKATRGRESTEHKAQAVKGATAQPGTTLMNPAVIESMYWREKVGLTDSTCKVDMDPIDGISNPAIINGGIDFWGVGAGDRHTKYGSFDVLFNHRLFSFMSLPVSWEGGLGIGYLRREGHDSWAPSAVLGGLAPPLYLIHGLWRNELGVQARGYLLTSSPREVDGYGTAFLRSSLEVATVVFRLQAGPTVDFRTGNLGFAGAVGVEFAGLRWITGGGSLKDF